MLNYDAITLEDCIFLYEVKGQEVIIKNGKIVGFVYGGTEDGNK